MVTHLSHVREERGLTVPETWTERSRVVLEPIAAPSVLGLFGFAGATFIVAGNLAGWYGNSTSALFLFPFAALFGGLAQFIAGLYGFRARDVLATAMHGTWGSFWLAYGLLYLLAATHAITLPGGTHFLELGMWFWVLAAITLAGTVAALAENIGLALVLAALTGGSVCAGVAYTADSGSWETVAGYFFVVSAAIAFYVASAMMLEATYERVVLPLGRTRRAEPATVDEAPAVRDDGPGRQAATG